MEKTEKNALSRISNLSPEEKASLFQVEELEPRLEMGGWGGDDSCNGSCDNGNTTCDSCCGSGDPCCNDSCGDLGCDADLDVICIVPV